MLESVLTAILGVVCIVIGIMNRKGNISMLHSYHTKKIAEGDKLAFGRLVGLGTLIIGVALIVMSVLTLVATISKQSIYSTIGGGILIAGFVSGLGISFYAMFKYNKGIF